MNYIDGHIPIDRELSCRNDTVLHSLITVLLELIHQRT